MVVFEDERLRSYALVYEVCESDSHFGRLLVYRQSRKASSRTDRPLLGTHNVPLQTNMACLSSPRAAVGRRVVGGEVERLGSAPTPLCRCEC